MDDEVLFEKLNDLYAAVSRPPPELHRKWTEAHDRALMDSLRKHGCRWRRIAEDVQFSTDDGVRNRVLRWNFDELPKDVLEIVRHLKGRPRRARGGSVTHKPFSAAEDSIISQAMERADGWPSWKLLQRESFSSRSTQSIRNRAYRLTLLVQRNQANVRKIAAASAPSSSATAA